MATEEKQDVEVEEEESSEEQSKGSRKRGLLARILTPKGIAILVGVSVIAHGISFAYYRMNKANAQTVASEVALGSFRFEGAKNEKGRIAKAEFSIHIALLDQVNDAAHQRLQSRRFRVQQDIEELLRQAHSGDFDDPNLGELKRQLQEKVNETLGIRAIADVIITNLKIEQRQGDAEAIDKPTETLPWVEKKPE